MLTFFSANKAFCQSIATPRDTIFTLTRDTLATNVTSVSSSKIFYCHPDSSTVREVERKRVQRIVYASGKVEVYNKPVFATIASTDWRAVILTDKRADVDGLYLRAIIIGRSSSNISTAFGAKTSAETMAKKKGAYNGGIYVLVTDRKEIGGYGETPKYYIEGEVYGTEPLPDSAKMKNEIKRNKPKKLL